MKCLILKVNLIIHLIIFLLDNKNALNALIKDEQINNKNFIRLLIGVTKIKKQL